MKINEKSSVEELVERFPGIVNFLSTKGLQCIVCGEPVWGTIGQLARDKGYTEEEIGTLLSEMNSLFTIPDAGI